MEIQKKNDGDKLTVKVKGRLDTTTAPELAEALKADVNGLEKLIFDFSELDYISSAGLRVLLICKKALDPDGGELIVKGCNQTILEVFDITGFSDFLSVER